MTDVDVALGPQSYVVRIGSGVSSDLSSLIPKNVRKVVICVDESLADDDKTKFETDVETFRIVVPGGEANKNLEAVQSLCREFARVGLQRSDLVVSVGGGVVTDMVGLAASLFNRGVSVIHIPTTLLGQVDAAIGGKTAANIPEGKNLVGTFHQPLAVLCDTDFLTTLPARQWITGMGEVCKCALVVNEDLKALSTEEMIIACVIWKAEIVSNDEREAARRGILNYGHTLAHALESAGVPLSHGEAVGVGLCFAAHLAEELGRIDIARRDAIVGEVERYSLPTSLPHTLDADDLLLRMGRDKKRVDEGSDELTFVLDGPNGVEVVRGIPVSIVGKVLKEWLS